MNIELTIDQKARSRKCDEIIRLADYVLGGNFEEEGLLNEINDLRSCGMSRVEIKRQIKANHIWYVAYKTLYGKKEASMRLTEITREALG